MFKVFFSEFIDITASYNINRPEIEALKASIQVGGICTVRPDITIKDKAFCFTGTSSRIKRDELEKIVVSLAGLHHNGVTQKTDYLVIKKLANLFDYPFMPL